VPLHTGVLGLVTNETAEVQSILDWFKLPLLKAEELPSADQQRATITELALQFTTWPIRLGLKKTSNNQT
jgi:hypothetical protein